ncbi:MAG: hypothetical protein QF921_13135 [Pseudomonadales bacterium]|jgi:putative ABC transport system permease protein|nr:hypothetical protein [Pseudomonadales bacterium]
MMLREIVAAVAVNLGSLSSRFASGAIIVVGVAGVVAVLLGLMAMSRGYQAVLTETAQPDRALVMRAGREEMDGFVTNLELGMLESISEIEILSGEVYATLTATMRDDGSSADVVVRGVTSDAFALRPEVQIIAGRRFEPGRGEIIVGVGALSMYEGLEIGDRLEVRRAEATVVGHFTAGGTAVESEVWVDLPVAQDVYSRQGGVSVVRARVAFDEQARVADVIDSNPALELELIPEVEFYARQSADRAVLIDTFAYFVAGIMALGSVIAALNTMYTVVSRRTIEIATLRAIGFGGSAIVVSVMIEAMLLAIVGGLIGAVCVYLALDGYATSATGTSTQVAFAFRVTPDLIVTGLSWALALGLLGGLLPALRAARLPVTDALRTG